MARPYLHGHHHSDLEHELFLNSDFDDSNHKFNHKIKIKSVWVIDKKGNGTWESEIETKFGKDNSWWELKFDFEKEEHKETEYEIEFLKSFKVLKHTDIKIGTLYEYMPNREVGREDIYFLMGIDFLSKDRINVESYFFNNLDHTIFMEIEIDKNFKMNEKLSLKPYLEADYVVKDSREYAKKTGLNQLQLGLEGRYSVTHNIIPFVDISYAYNKGRSETLWQNENKSNKDWGYDIGIEVKF